MITQQDLFPTRSLRDNSFTWKADVEDGVAFKLSLADLVFGFVVFLITALRLSFSDITRVWFRSIADRWVVNHIIGRGPTAERESNN